MNTSIEKLQAALDHLEKTGLYGDKHLVHVNDDEIALLEALTGNKTRHPITNRRQFYASTDSQGDNNAANGMGPSSAQGSDGPGVGNTGGNSGSNSSGGDSYASTDSQSDNNAANGMGPSSAQGFDGPSVDDSNGTTPTSSPQGREMGVNATNPYDTLASFRAAAAKSKELNDSFWGKIANFFNIGIKPDIVNGVGKVDFTYSINPLTAALTMVAPPLGLLAKAFNVPENLGIPDVQIASLQRGLGINGLTNPDAPPDWSQTPNEFGNDAKQTAPIDSVKNTIFKPDTTTGTIDFTATAKAIGEQFGESFGQMPQFTLLDNNFGKDFKDKLSKDVTTTFDKILTNRT